MYLKPIKYIMRIEYHYYIKLFYTTLLNNLLIHILKIWNLSYNTIIILINCKVINHKSEESRLSFPTTSSTEKRIRQWSKRMRNWFVQCN